MKKVEEGTWKSFAALFERRAPYVMRGILDPAVRKHFEVRALCERFGSHPVKVAKTDRGLVRLNPEKGHYYDDQAADVPFDQALTRLAREVVAETYLPRLPLEEIASGRELLALLPGGEAPAGQKLVTATLWIGPRSNKMPLHHDFADNLFYQAVGRKTFVLLSPEHELRDYRLPVRKAGTRSIWHGTRIVDVGAECARPGSRLPKDQFHKVTLEPGDVLWLPNLWWHEVTSHDTPTISAASWWSHATMAEIQKKIEQVTALGEAANQLPEDWKRRIAA